MSNNLIDQGFPDVFACELAKVEKLGRNRRLIFTVPTVEGNGYQNVVAKLIISADYLPTLIHLLSGGTDRPQPEVSPELLCLETGTVN